MNEKSFFIFGLFVLGFLILSAGLLSGCRTVGSEVNKPLIEHSVAVERSQNAQRELIAIIDRAERRLDVIEKTAGSLSGNIDRLAELFAEYDKIVRELIEGVKQIEAGLSGGKKADADITDDSGGDNSR
ncbi:MAG: hypothetical protein LBV17_07735 [Treponema sp.]|jgi:superfamily II RNA helicase|nr:hypothetical protein [Treponema sp.]